MEPLPAKKGRYRPPVEEEDGSDYDETGSQGNSRLTTKYKNSITINPTEGFRYSDMYLVRYVLYMCVMYAAVFSGTSN